MQLNVVLRPAEKPSPPASATDTQCDRLQIAPGHHHAYLIPAEAILPMVPRGPVFRVC